VVIRETGVVSDQFAGVAMSMKAIALFLIVGVGLLLFLGLRTTNSAQAADGNCYSSGQGPSQPTICN
jgi:hypothetical protein